MKLISFTGHRVLLRFLMAYSPYVRIGSAMAVGSPVLFRCMRSILPVGGLRACGVVGEVRRNIESDIARLSCGDRILV